MMDLDLFYTEWNKSEREKQIPYINAYKWNIEKRYRWTYLQDLNWDTHIENKYMDTKVGREDGMDREIRIDIYMPFGGGNGTPLQYSCLENPIDRRAW